MTLIVSCTIKPATIPHHPFSACSVGRVNTLAEAEKLAAAAAKPGTRRLLAAARNSTKKSTAKKDKKKKDDTPTDAERAIGAANFGGHDDWYDDDTGDWHFGNTGGFYSYVPRPLLNTWVVSWSVLGGWAGLLLLPLLPQLPPLPAAVAAAVAAAVPLLPPLPLPPPLLLSVAVRWRLLHGSHCAAHTREQLLLCPVRRRMILGCGTSFPLLRSTQMAAPGASRWMYRPVA